MDIKRLAQSKEKNILTENFLHVFCYEFQAGEASKNTDTVNGVYEFLFQNHFLLSIANYAKRPMYALFIRKAHMSLIL